jgi:hypothetical protein
LLQSSQLQPQDLAMKTGHWVSGLAAGLWALGVAGAADDTQALFLAGRTSFYKGDFEQAHAVVFQPEAG